MTLGPVTAFAPEEARRRAMVLLSEAKSGGDPAAQRDADRKAATVKGSRGALSRRVCPRPLQAEHGLPVPALGRALHRPQDRPPQGDGNPEKRHRRAASRPAQDALPSQSHVGRALEDVQPGRDVGPASRRLEPLPARQAVQGGEARAVPEHRGVPAPRLGPRRNPRGRLRDPLGGRGDPAADAHRLPAFGNPDAALGTCRSGGGRVAIARHQDWRARRAACTLGGAAAGIAAAQRGQPVGDRRKKAGSHLTDLQHPWRRIRARAELADVRIHDLRHSCASKSSKSLLLLCSFVSSILPSSDSHRIRSTS